MVGTIDGASRSVLIRRDGTLVGETLPGPTGDASSDCAGSRCTLSPLGTLDPLSVTLTVARACTEVSTLHINHAGLRPHVPNVRAVASSRPETPPRPAERFDLRRALDASRNAISIFERESLRFLYVNQGAVQQLGYSEDELLSMTQPQVDTALTEAGFRRLVDGLAPGASIVFPTVHRRKDGSELTVESMLHHPPTDGGADRPSPWIVSIARDISERIAAHMGAVAAEREISAREARQGVAESVYSAEVRRLFGLGLAAASLRSRTDDPFVKEQLGAIVAGLDESISHLRSSIFELESYDGRPAP